MVGSPRTLPVWYHAFDIGRRTLHLFGDIPAGGVDEDELGGVVGVDAGYFVARGLCFFTGDADFLPDEVVHQGGFADVGTADDGDEAAAVAVWDGVFGTRGVGVGHWFSFLQV